MILTVFIESKRKRKDIKNMFYLLFKIVRKVFKKAHKTMKKASFFAATKNK